MNDILKYKQVNWIDGMKINKEHFIGQENYFSARIHDINNNLLDKNNYGLLANIEESSNFLDVGIVVDNQNYLKVKVKSCHAITPGGFRIEIGDEFSDQEDFVIQDVETTYDIAAEKHDDLFIILSVEPFSRIPEGKATPGVYPVRLPFVQPKYELYLVPDDQVIGYELGPNMLSIGRIKITDEKPVLDNSYIPPCTSIEAHPKLMEFHAYVEEHIGYMERNIAKIIYDIKEKDASNILTEIVTFISDKVLYFVSTNITRLNWLLRSQAPIHLFEFIVTLARVLKNSFDIRTAEEKEVLLNYFSEHFDIVPSMFKKLLENTISLNYEHTNIYHYIENTENFLNVVSLLFNELSKMELIAGKKKKVEPRRIDITLK